MIKNITSPLKVHIIIQILQKPIQRPNQSAWCAHLTINEGTRTCSCIAWVPQAKMLLQTLLPGVAQQV